MRVFAASWFGVLILPLVLACAFTAPALAGERDDELALRAVEAQVEQLMQQARRLREAGEVVAAENAQVRAKELQRKVAELRELRKRLPSESKQQDQGEREAKRRRAIAHGLAQGIEALRELGRKEDAARLERILADVKRDDGAQAREREQHAKREAQERELQGMADLEPLEQRIRVMKLALPALREGERKDAIEILERAIQTGRVLLAEREDEEARQILERTPPLPQLARVLHLASELWMKFGHETKARLVGSLAGRYAEQAKRAEREEAQERDEEDEARAHEERRAGRQEAGREREHARPQDVGRQDALKHLHMELQELRAALERMQRQLRELAK